MSKIIIMMLLVMCLFLINLGCAIQVPCNSAIICPNTSAEFTCTVQNTAILQWIVPVINSPDDSQWTLLLVSVGEDHLSSAMGIYSASVTDGDATYVSSKLTFIGPTEVNNNNMEIICIRGTSSSDENIMSCPFIIEGEPSSPINVTVVAIDVDTVNLSWSSPLSGSNCIDHYIASVSNGSTVQNHTTNLTSTVINGLEAGLNYSFSVLAVDYGGRGGTASETVTVIIINVPDEVSSTAAESNSATAINKSITVKTTQSGDHSLKNDSKSQMSETLAVSGHLVNSRIYSAPSQAYFLSHTSSTSSILQTSSSQLSVVLVSVGVVCGILFVAFFIISVITITLVILLIRIKKIKAADSKLDSHYDGVKEISMKSNKSYQETVFYDLPRTTANHCDDIGNKAMQDNAAYGVL